MYEKTATIINKSGLHARPASDFISAAKEYQSSITIETLTPAAAGPVNAKSIIALLSLGVCQGTTVKISAEGPDAQEAVEALVALIGSGFGE